MPPRAAGCCRRTQLLTSALIRSFHDLRRLRRYRIGAAQADFATKLPFAQLDIEAVGLGEEGGAGSQHRVAVHLERERPHGGVQGCGHGDEGRASSPDCGAVRENPQREARFR